MDSFKILTHNRVVWLNLTGNGNETSAHIQLNPCMTIMFCAFDDRLHGKAKVIHKNENDWNMLYLHFNPVSGARQIFDLCIDLVQTSCGMAVPYYTYTADRGLLSDWAKKKGNQELKLYWEEKNQSSIDHLPIHIQKNWDIN